MKKKTMTLPKFGRGAEVRAASFDEAANTVEVTWTTGAAVRRYSYRDGVYYQEVLEVSPEAVRLERLNAGAPFLNSHSSYELANVIGSVVPGTARIENGVGVATILLSTAGEDAGIVEKIRAGVIRNVSVGYIIHRVEKTVNGDGADEEWRVVDWEPMEISAVPIPADPGSQIRGAAPDGQPCEFTIRNDAPDDGANEAPDTSAGTTQEDALSDLNAAETVRETTTGKNNNNNVMEARVAETEIETRAAADIEAAARAATDTAIRAERERVAKINELADKHGARALGNEFIGNGKGLEDFRAALLDHLASAEKPTDTGLRATVGTEHVEKRAAVIEAAIMHRVDPAKNALPEGGREFRGMSLVDMARDLLDANGVKVRGMNKFEIASEALSQRSGGLHGTGDFTVILGNTVNRTLRTAYEAAPQTFRPVVRETTVSDFKTVTRAQLGEAPKLEKVNEHGEFKRGTIGEGSESYKVATFGKVIGITRQALINDDLGAFTRLAQMFGVAAADLESDLVWAEILGNPVMGDTVALFHATHKNLQTAAAMSEATLAVMRAAMAKQKGLDGKTTLNIRPTFLFVPVDLENSAEKLLASYATTKPSDAVAESIRRLQAISEPRLDNGLTHPVTGAAIAGSSTAHYLAASPAQTDTVELAYLEGARGVYTESKMGFNTDGVEIKVRLDAGAKVIDWRAFQKNAGA
jgi:phage head maturation protease